MGQNAGFFALDQRHMGFSGILRMQRSLWIPYLPFLPFGIYNI